MQGKTRYFRRSHISDAKCRATINQLFMKLRIRVAQVWNASSALSGEVEIDESYFGARRVRGKRGAEQAVKRSSSESWNATEKCWKSSLTPPRRSYKRDLGSGSPGEASSTRTAGEATMGWWTWAIKSISGCIMVSMSLPAVIAISMALSHSGHIRNGGLQNSMVSPRKPSFYTSRNVNSDLITERWISLIEYLLY